MYGKKPIHAEQMVCSIFNLANLTKFAKLSNYNHSHISHKPHSYIYDKKKSYYYRSWTVSATVKQRSSEEKSEKSQI